MIGGLESSNMIQFWDMKSGEYLLGLCGHSGKVTVLKTIGKYLLASGSDDSSIIIWNLTNLNIYHTLNGHTGSIKSIEYLSTQVLVKYFYI